MEDNVNVYDKIWRLPKKSKWEFYEKMSSTLHPPEIVLRLTLNISKKMEWNVLSTKLHLGDFQWAARVLNKPIVHYQCWGLSWLHQDQLWSVFSIKCMFISLWGVVINALTRQMFCKGLGFLGLGYQSDYSKVFFTLSIMQCWISDV